MKKNLDSGRSGREVVKPQEKSLLQRSLMSPAIWATVVAVGASVFVCTGDKKDKASEADVAVVAPDRGVKDEGPAVEAKRAVPDMKITVPELRPVKNLLRFSFTPVAQAGSLAFESVLKAGTDLPAGLEDADFKRVSERFAGIAEKDMEANMAPRVTGNRMRDLNILGEYITGLASKLKGLNAACAADIAAWDNDQNANLSALIPIFNRYLIRAGYFMELNSFSSTDVRFDLYKIEGVRFVKVSDGEISPDVPVLEVGKSMGPKEVTAVEGGIIATCDPGFTKMIFYKDNVASGTERMVGRMAMFGGEMSAAEKELLAGKVVDDYLRHEATHIYLARKFPRAGTMVTKGVRINQPIVVSLGGGEVRLGGQVPPVMFHELCGIGMQMAGSEITYPHMQVTYGSATPREDDPYELVYSMMPLASLMALKDGREKDALQTGLLEGGQLELQDLFRQMPRQPDPVAYNREVGRTLYTLGYRVLEKTEAEMGR